LSILACWPFTDLSWFSVDSNRFSESAIHSCCERLRFTRSLVETSTFSAPSASAAFAFVAAEDPHGGQNQPDAGDPGEQHSLLAAHRFVARQFASDRETPRPPPRRGASAYE
jgi:hypothetical protein